MFSITSVCMKRDQWTNESNNNKIQCIIFLEYFFNRCEFQSYKKYPPKLVGKAITIAPATTTVRPENHSRYDIYLCAVFIAADTATDTDAAANVSFISRNGIALELRIAKSTGCCMCVHRDRRCIEYEFAETTRTETIEYNAEK